MTSHSFTLNIEMLSDWRIGSGKGRQGGVDELIQRDRDGLPFIPASTFRGVWRDAAEQLAFALDGAQPSGLWQDAVAGLFGSQPALETDNRGKRGQAPITSILALSPATMNDDVRNVLSGKKKRALRAALTFNKPGVAINPETGSAEHDMLRFIEMSRAGAELKCEVDLATNDEVCVALAKASAMMVQSIGGGRRRGAGKCQVSILGLEVKSAVEKLKGEAPAAIEPVHRLTAVEYDVASSGAFTRYPLTIELLSPVIIPDAILGNTVVTKNFIPGTHLLGPVLSALGLSKMDSAIVNGDIRVLPAYPESNGTMCTPTPVSWREVKDGGKNAPLINQIRQQESKGEVWKASSAPFCRQNDDTPWFVNPSISIFTHNTVEDLRQTPTSDVGGVYSYEAISAGQVFRSEIWIRDSLEIASVEASNSIFRIGRAVNAGYGRVRIAVGKGTQHSGQVVSNGEGTVVLYFATDCLLPCHCSPEQGLIRLLTEAGIEGEPDELLIKTVRLEGWMPRAGLPKSSQFAIKAGSVVTFSKIKGDLTVLQSEGLGQRRAEGFGVVQVNPELVVSELKNIGDEPGSSKGDADQKLIRHGDISENSLAFIGIVQDTALRNWIRKQSELFANNPDKRANLIGKNTEMSQLANLRAVMAGLPDDASVKTVAKWLSTQGKPWMSELSGIFGSPKFIWRCAENLPENLIVVGAESDIIKENSEYTRYLMLSLISASVRAYKRELEPQKKKEAA